MPRGGITRSRAAQRTEEQLRDLLLSRDFDAWSEALARVGNCVDPIRLHGHSQKVDTATGEVLSTYSSRQEPLGGTTCAAATAAPTCARPAPGSTPATPTT